MPTFSLCVKNFFDSIRIDRKRKKYATQQQVTYTQTRVCKITLRDDCVKILHGNFIILFNVLDFTR